MHDGLEFTHLSTDLVVTKTQGLPHEILDPPKNAVKGARKSLLSDISFRGLLALNQGAVGGGRFPCAGIVHPRVAADDGPCAMFAADVSVVVELVMGNCGVGTKGRHLHISR
jgi:hypothetical protein